MKELKTYYLREKTEAGDGKVLPCRKLSDFVRGAVWYINTNSNDEVVSYDRIYRKAIGLLKVMSNYLEYSDEILIEVDNEIYLNMDIFYKYDQLGFDEKMELIEIVKAEGAKNND